MSALIWVAFLSDRMNSEWRTPVFVDSALFNVDEIHRGAINTYFDIDWDLYINKIKKVI